MSKIDIGYFCIKNDYTIYPLQLIFLINDVQTELYKSKDSTITRIFTFNFTQK